MSQALIGKKIGMSRLFTEEGASIPVTVIELQPSRVVAIKTIDNDGYDAVQVTTGEIKASKLTKAEKGHFAKANVEPGVILSEIRAENKAIFNKNLDEIQAGAVFDLSVFDKMKKVDVSGVTKGKGFAGVIKRWNFSMQDATHGNSLSHRAPGSIGQTQTPGRVWKGKKMAGQMGNKKATVQSLEIVRIDPQQQLILLKGGVPGAPGTMVRLAPSVKLKNNFLE